MSVYAQVPWTFIHCRIYFPFFISHIFMKILSFWLVHKIKFNIKKWSAFTLTSCGRCDFLSYKSGAVYGLKHCTFVCFVFFTKNIYRLFLPVFLFPFYLLCYFSPFYIRVYMVCCCMYDEWFFILLKFLYIWKYNLEMEWDIFIPVNFNLITSFICF